MRRLLFPAVTLLAACQVTKIADKQTMVMMAPSIMGMSDVGLACATGAALMPVVGSLGKKGERRTKRWCCRPCQRECAPSSRLAMPRFND